MKKYIEKSNNDNVENTISKVKNKFEKNPSTLIVSRKYKQGSRGRTRTMLDKHRFSVS